MPSKLTGSITHVSVTTYQGKKPAPLPSFLRLQLSLPGCRVIEQGREQGAHKHTPDSADAELTQQGFTHLALDTPLSAPLRCDRFKQALSEQGPRYHSPSPHHSTPRPNKSYFTALEHPSSEDPRVL